MELRRPGVTMMRLQIVPVVFVALILVIGAPLGGTASAQPVTGHGQKLLDRRTQLQRMFRSLEGDDRRVARDLLSDIQDALGGG